MFQKRLVTALLAAVLFYIFQGATPGATAAEEPMVGARAAVLMDRETGRVLWEKEAHLRLPMASTTKIMTCLLALEYGCEDDLTRVSARAAATEGSSIWLEEGEEKLLRELLYGLMLCSGNDAAVAIAEHLAGSVERFAAMMNEKAREIGARHTHFSNPHGLPDDNHYTTAYDLALITAYALKNQRFREIVSTPAYSISWPGRQYDRYLSNQNRLLEIYPGGDGVKTGWTREAGRCFVGSATRDGWQLVAVVLDAPQMWEDTTALLDYGFNAFKRKKVLYRGQVVGSAEVAKGEGRVAVVVGEDFFYPLQPGEKELIRYRFSLQENITAPLEGGEQLGEIALLLADEPMGRAELQAGHAVRRTPLISFFLQLWALFLE